MFLKIREILLNISKWYILSRIATHTTQLKQQIRFSSTSASGADSLGHEGTVNRRTSNKKVTKLYWPSRKR